MYNRPRRNPPSEHEEMQTMSQTPLKKIGFIGLGQMGQWMALNVLKAGFELHVHDVDQAAMDRLAREGAHAAASPAELAAPSQCIVLSLPNTQIVERVIFGERGVVEGARPGTVILDCGTTSYMPTLKIDKELRDLGIRFADAPVSGMEARAREGALTIMYGGDAALFSEVVPVLQSMGNKILHMGDTGSGQLTKLINQLLFNISCAALAEVLPMAVKLGLDPEKVCQVITSGTGRSFAAEFFTPHILEGRFDQGYPLNAAYKDMMSASEISAQMQIPLPVSQAATVTYQMALADGHGDEDKGAMIKVFEKILGVRVRKRQEEP